MLQVDLCTAPGRDERARPLETLSGRASALSFGSALPGGFSQCSFSMALSNSEAFEWYANKIGLLVLVHEGGQTIWEGRIVGVNLQPFGITVVAEGYWNDLISRNTYQWWGVFGADGWKVPGFSTLVTSAGLPAIPWSNQLFTAEGIGEGFYIAPNPGQFLVDDAAAFVYILPVPPVETDAKDFWQIPNMVRRIEADVEITNGIWSDASNTRMEVEVYITDDPHAGTWTREPITQNFGPDTSGDLKFAQGSYIGDGTTDGSKKITGLGFPPDVVCISGQNATEGHAVFRASNMAQLRNFTNATQDDGIVSLDNDGFTVKDDLPSSTGSTNNSSVTYYWWAFAGPNIEVGTYTGDGEATQDIPTTFDPVMVWVFRESSGDVMIRQENMGSESYDFGVSLGETDEITALGTLKFTVGAGTEVNSDGVVYNYIAFKASPNLAFGKYTGDGGTNRLIPNGDAGSDPTIALPFKPELVSIKADAGQQATMATLGMGNFGLPYATGSAETDTIDSLKAETGKFRVDDDLKVNASSVVYYYFSVGEVIALAQSGHIKIDLTVFDVRGVMFRINVGNGATKTFDGTVGSARVEVTGVKLKNYAGDLVPGEILKRAIGGSITNFPLHDHLSTRTLFIQETPQSELLNVIYEGVFMQEVVEQLGHLGDPSNLRSWFGAVWDGRVFHFGPRDIENVKWRISKKQLSDSGLALERSLQNFWSHVQAFYEDSHTVKQSSTVRSDAQFRDNVPATRRQVVDMGKVPYEGARDVFYEDFKIAQPQAEIEVNGLALNAYGVPEPLWRIRAGDVFQIDDLFPGRYIKGTDAIDPLRTFMVREASYNVDDNMLTISPTWAPARMDVLMANVQALTS